MISKISIPKRSSPGILDILKKHRWLVAFILAFAGVVNVYAWEVSQNHVLKAAYSFPNGGGWCKLNDTGVPETIRHRGSVILPMSNGGSYCCGFTFAVAMKVADHRGLIADKSVSEMRRFQKLWYGAEKGSGLKECVDAMVELGIGREVPHAEAEPGDFVVFHRTNGIGHSVVFLNWVRDRSGSIVGLRYRSSQPDTSGVGDLVEYFAQAGSYHGDIDRDRLFVARLNSGSWWRMLYPF